MVYRVVTGVERFSRDDLVIEDTRVMRGHGTKLKRRSCRRDIKKHSFPQRYIETWNNIDKEPVNVGMIHDFRVKLNLCRYGDRTALAWLFSSMSQRGEYTHTHTHSLTFSLSHCIILSLST